VQDRKTPDYRARAIEVRDRIKERFTGLTGRRRSLAIGAAAIVGFGLVTAGAIAVTDSNPTPTTSAVSQQGVSERSDADRADRSDRTAPGAAPTTTTQAPPKASTPAPPKAPPKAPATKAAPPAPPKPKPAPAWVHPMPGAQVTSCFGPRWGTAHEGIDYAARNGTPIHTIGNGTVVKSGDVGDGYGISVFVDHGNGYLTQYAHMSKAAVGYGAKVKPGQVIGYEGSTGDSTGPHLHFEVHKGMWNQIEPARWLRSHGVNPGGC